VVAIRDDGCGMNAKFTGMGIGVYESQEFAEGAGGELAVESAPGAGTTFYLRLPRLEPPAAAGAR
jgi:signal transduction histidine kinase